MFDSNAWWIKATPSTTKGLNRSANSCNQSISCLRNGLKVYPIDVYLVADNLLLSVVFEMAISLESPFNKLSEFRFEMGKVVDEVMYSQA